MTGNPRDDAAANRARMVALQIEARGIRDPSTLEAMRHVPREEFVPASLRHRAYEDGALSIGRGQTISQPYIVARSTAALHLDTWIATHPGVRPHVLDVGTGSGYQAAVLAAMDAAVTSIEFDAELADEASQRLQRLGYAVRVVIGDGSEGYREDAPYAGIVVAAAAPVVPAPLLEQLADGATLVIPIGTRGEQMLTAYTRRGHEWDEQPLEPAVFVPLLGRYGFR
jgi:protein-L-isoaspartate(D-aspartate) O-methyltransferase